MSAYCVSVIVTENGKIIESELLRVDVPLEREQALAFRAELEPWLNAIPDPLTAGQPKHRETVDPATLLAVRLPAILNGRDPALFGPYYEDPEAERAAVEHTVYDQARLLEEAA